MFSLTSLYLSQDSFSPSSCIASCLYLPFSCIASCPSRLLSYPSHPPYQQPSSPSVCTASCPSRLSCKKGRMNPHHRPSSPFLYIASCPLSSWKLFGSKKFQEPGQLGSWSHLSVGLP